MGLTYSSPDMTGVLPESATPQERCARSSLYFDVDAAKLPLVYSDNYNIAFMGLERLHPFDSCKWRHIVEFLVEDKAIAGAADLIEPREATMDDLLVCHTHEYLASLEHSGVVAQITEVPPVAMLPSRIVEKHVLQPFRLHTGGTVLGGKLATERGWAINIGGGFHHCSARHSHGGGFCAYADITLCIEFLFARLASAVKRVLIVDLDAHQGNGHERDFMHDGGRVAILDMYNASIYPYDVEAKKGITYKVELRSGTGDEEYLELLRSNLAKALREFKPDFVVYNAGTDVLVGDPLGHLDITPQGIIERDETVAHMCTEQRVPFLMVTSGGYQKSTARIIADSILNMKAKGLLPADAWLK
eukprot:Opistho-1_new@22223